MLERIFGKYLLYTEECINITKASPLSDKFPLRCHFYLLCSYSRLSVACDKTRGNRQRTTSILHQFYFPAREGATAGGWGVDMGGTLTYTPPLSLSWSPPTILEIELPQGATWRLNTRLQQAPQGPIVHSSLSGKPCYCNLWPVILPRDNLFCVDPKWTFCGYVV